MKKIILSSIGVAALLLCQQASAIPVNILGTGDFNADGISTITGNPGLGDANVLAWLQAEATLNNFPAPTTGQSDYTGGPISAGDYLVLHYGSGPGGNPAGGLVALYFDAAQDSYAVPANGSGPNGFGGISFARLYDHTTTSVPDSGTTLAMLGMGLCGIGCVTRLKSQV